MRSPLTVALLLFAASTLLGQDKPVVANVATVTGVCPIGFAGDQTASSSAKLLAKNPEQNGAVGLDSPVASTRPLDRPPHLELSFDGSKASAKLLKVQVTVHGFPKGPHLMLVNGSSDNSVSESFELMSYAKVAATSFRSEVYTQTVGIAQWADITQINYADGSIWHPSSGSTCRVNFTGIKLVNTAR